MINRQPVPSGEWTVSAIDPYLFMIHDVEHVMIVVWNDEGPDPELSLDRPERWHFARANVRARRWETSSECLTPPVEWLDELIADVKESSD